MRTLYAAVLGMVMLTACNVDELPGPTSDTSAIFQRLDATQRAITLTTTAPNNSVQLVVLPKSADGSVIETAVHPTFMSGDPAIASVSTDGVVTMLQANQPVTITIQLSMGNVTRSTMVTVFAVDTPTLPTVSSFRIHLAPSDSAKMPAQSGRQIPVEILDDDGNPLSLPVRFWQTNTVAATIDEGSGWLQAIGMGTTTVYATMTVHGTTYTDSMTFRIGLPLKQVEVPVLRRNSDGSHYYTFGATEIRIPVGGTVDWFYAAFSGPQYDVVFDQPDAAEDDPSSYYSEGHGGNIAVWIRDPENDGSSGARSRKFSVAGQYPFHSVTLNASGTVIVVDEHACLPSCP